MRRVWIVLLLLLLPACASPAAALPPPATAAVATPRELESIFRYIRQGWSTLERSNRHLLQAARDPKFERRTGPWPVYIAPDEDRAQVEAALRAQMPEADFAQIELRSLPATDPGILYLPYPYVVPGGRFNEMYGWDSYFILLGLLRDGETSLARGMVDNFVYEIDHYGTILNANRSYYLTRSQPPLLTEMILGVFRATGDRAWLRGTLPAVERYHGYFTSEPHLTPTTGLSRYHDLGHGPAPEVADERDRAGRTHYDRVRDWYRTHAVTDYDVSRLYDRGRDTLTDLFYVADRSMRESGYDPSDRFGPFNAGVLDFDPVCLNSLLYRMERDTAEILRALGDGDAAGAWEQRAGTRAATIERLLWDPGRDLYLDYDFVKEERRVYPFATTFFPLWAGLSSKDHAARLVPAALAELETPGGIRTSTRATGNQWDAPFGWAPLQVIAVEGLRRYGYAADAERISVSFLSLVLAEFLEHHAIFEKYDVERRDSAVGAGIRFGYASNEIGFGWTNAAFVTLFDALPEPRRAAVRRLGR
jgi:alpha,alpha-trehalase